MNKNIKNNFIKVSNSVQLQGVKLQKSVHEAIDVFFTSAFIITDMAKNLSEKAFNKASSIKNSNKQEEFKNQLKTIIDKEVCR